MIPTVKPCRGGAALDARCDDYYDNNNNDDIDDSDDDNCEGLSEVVFPKNATNTPKQIMIMMRTIRVMGMMMIMIMTGVKPCLRWCCLGCQMCSTLMMMIMTIPTMMMAMKMMIMIEALPELELPGMPEVLHAPPAVQGLLGPMVAGQQLPALLLQRSTPWTRWQTCVDCPSRPSRLSTSQGSPSPWSQVSSSSSMSSSMSTSL